MDFISAYQSLKGGCQEGGDSLLSVVPSDVTRRNGCSLEHREFHLHVRRNFFMLRVVEHWNRLAQRDGRVSGGIQRLLGCHPMQSALGEPPLVGELEQMISGGPFQHLSFSDSVVS